MPAFKVEVPHNLSQAEVIESLHCAVHQSVEQYQQHLKKAEGGWNDNVLSFCVTALGMTVKGTMTVGEKKVHVRASCRSWCCHCGAQSKAPSSSN